MSEDKHHGSGHGHDEDCGPDNPTLKPDGTVEGTAGSDLIDQTYTGDPNGDKVDSGDAILPGAAPQDDLIYGYGGDDLINAGEGEDVAYGGDGNDLVYGNIGNDTLYGDAGNDLVKGGSGDDTLYGGTGDDEIRGGDDRDTIVYKPGDGSDVVYGGDAGDDFDTLDLTGLPPGSFRIVDTTPDSDGNGIDGTVEILDGDGNVVETIRFENIEQIVPCFTPGTLIATPRGEKLVEELQVGDRIITRDNGIQEIRWVGHTALTGRDMIQRPHLKPVMIKAGALGNGLPERDTIVSPNHRLLVASERTQLYFDESEVLAAAKHLVGTDGIFEMTVTSTTYIHFMFDRHEVVLSNGAWTESFQPGDMSLEGLGNAQRTEILELFPELATRDGLDGYMAARKSLKKHEARLLMR